MPPQLSALESGLELLKSFFDNANYPQARSRVENDIIAFHSLSAAQSQKYQDAKDTIAQNQQLLDAAKNVTTQNEKGSYLLNQEREQFELYKKGENKKLDDQRENNKTDAESNKSLYNKAIEVQNDVAAREGALITAQETYAQNVAQLEIEKGKVVDKQKELDSLIAQANAGLADLNAKKEALKKLVS